jgi:hypothetical protein
VSILIAIGRDDGWYQGVPKGEKRRKTLKTLEQTTGFQPGGPWKGGAFKWV